MDHQVPTAENQGNPHPPLESQVCQLQHLLFQGDGQRVSISEGEQLRDVVRGQEERLRTGEASLPVRIPARTDGQDYGSAQENRTGNPEDLLSLNQN